MRIILDGEVKRAKVNLHKDKLCRQSNIFSHSKNGLYVNSVRDKVKKYSDILAF